jgi:hypothetical protein
MSFGPPPWERVKSFVRNRVQRARVVAAPYDVRKAVRDAEIIPEDPIEAYQKSRDEAAGRLITASSERRRHGPRFQEVADGEYDEHRWGEDESSPSFYRVHDW